MSDDISEEIEEIEEEAVSREDFDSWYEYIDYISFGSCGTCSSGRFYVLLGAITMGIINIGMFITILCLI